MVKKNQSKAQDDQFNYLKNEPKSQRWKLKIEKKN